MTETPEARCVWLTPADFMEPDDFRFRLLVTERFGAAPTANEVLVALGYPDGSPRQETPT